MSTARTMSRDETSRRGGGNVKGFVCWPTLVTIQSAVFMSEIDFDLTQTNSKCLIPFRFY